MSCVREVPLALHNDTIITPIEYTSRPIECVACNQEVYFRKQHKRNRNGMVYNVRCTFVHKSISNCESYEHRTAKKIIATTLSLWKFAIEKCHRCQTETTICFQQDTGVEEASFGSMKLDVGVYEGGHESKHIIGAVEIYKTHRVDKEKKRKLDDHIKWVEVDASDVIEAYQHKKFTLNCLHKTYRKCDKCRERLEMEEEEGRMKEYNSIIQYRLLNKEGVLKFGKYKGQHLDELAGGFSYFETRDHWYLRFLAGMANKKWYASGFPIPKVIKEKAKEYLTEYCLLCENNKQYEWQKLCTTCWLEHKNTCLRCEKYVRGNHIFCWECNKKINE